MFGRPHPSPLMVGYTIIYIVVLLFLAIHLFNTCDL